MTRPDAGHTFLTVDAGNACDVTASPFLGDCDYDQAEAILKWIYGGLQRPSQREEGKYVIFDQSPFMSGIDTDLAVRVSSTFQKHASSKEAAGCTLSFMVASKIARRWA